MRGHYRRLNKSARSSSKQVSPPTLAEPMILPTRRLKLSALLILATAVAASPSPQTLSLWWALGQGMMTVTIADALALLIRRYAKPLLFGSPLGLWRRRNITAGKTE